MTATMYGTADGVAGLVSDTYTDSTTHKFTTSTSPAKATVETWITQMSSVANVALADARFIIPITQADCVNALTGQIERAVAELCNYHRQTGRFFTQAMTVKADAMNTLCDEIRSWVVSNAQGMENAGAVRNSEQSGTDAPRARIIRARHTQDPYSPPL